MIEFVLVLPLLLLFLCSIIQYGYLISAYINVRATCALAARATVLEGYTGFDPNDDNDPLRVLVNSSLGQLLDPEQATMSVVDPYDTGSGPATRVQINYDLPLFFPLIVPGGTGGVFTITAVTVMR